MLPTSRPSRGISRRSGGRLTRSSTPSTLATVSSARTRIEGEFDPGGDRADEGDGGARHLGRRSYPRREALLAGQVDECHLFLTPVVVGGGTRWLPSASARGWICWMNVALATAWCIYTTRFGCEAERLAAEATSRGQFGHVDIVVQPLRRVRQEVATWPRGVFRFAQVAREVAEAALPRSRSPCSTHTFTPPTLLAILCLMR